jgi:hypothetical protein
MHSKQFYDGNRVVETMNPSTALEKLQSWGTSLSDPCNFTQSHGPCCNFNRAANNNKNENHDPQGSQIDNVTMLVQFAISLSILETKC